MRLDDMFDDIADSVALELAPEDPDRELLLDFCFRAARGALEKLRIARIHEIDLPGGCPHKDGCWCGLLENMCGFECKAECACPLRKGGVLEQERKAP